MADLFQYTFGGVATVSVVCTVEAESEKAARKMITAGDCEWACEEVDGNVTELELLSVEE